MYIIYINNTLPLATDLYMKLYTELGRLWTDASILTDEIFRYVGNAYFISSWVVCSPPFVNSFPLATVCSLVFLISPTHVRDNADLHLIMLAVILKCFNLNSNSSMNVIHCC